jgi:putative ABC transport system permease protein
VGLAIRNQGDQAALFSAVRSIVADLDSELPVHDIRSMSQVVAETLTTRRLTLWLIGSFGALALVLSFVGIYGVMSYTVTERVHEIGVRTALGAQRDDIFRLFIGSGMRLAGIGLIVGAATAFMATRAMTGLLFGVSSNDPATYAGIAALIATAAFTACYIPARHALGFDPIIALRCE